MKEEVSLTWEEFVERFMPIQNRIVNDAPLSGYMFETYGEELKRVRRQRPAHIWTYFDNGEITSGFYFVNRSGYLITERAAEENKIYSIKLKDD